MGKRIAWPAAAVLLLAWAARVVRLFDVPPGLSQDEILDADIALFIRQGRHALFFREGFGHEPLYHYWAVPFQALLGDNWLSVRLPPAVLGLLLIALTIGWLRGKGPARLALGTGLLLAVSWWPIIFSRIGIRPILLPLFLVGSAWLWEKKRPLASGLVLGLSFYTYTAARAMLLLPLVLLGYTAFEKWRSRETAPWSPAIRLAAAAYGLYLPLQIVLWVDPTLQQRLEQLSGPLDQLRQGDWQPILGTMGRTLGVFTFVGDPRWTYTVPEIPLFDPLTGLLFYAGLAVLLWRAFRERPAAFAAAWFGLGLLPSALSPQAPSIIRLIGILPLVYYLVVLGAERLLALGGRRFTGSAGWLLIGLAVLLGGVRSWIHGFQTWPAERETRLRYGTVWQAIGRAWEQTPEVTPVVADSWVDPIDQDSLRRDVGRPVAARWVQTGEGVVSGALVLPPGPARLYVPEYAPPAAELMAALGLEDPLFRQFSNPDFAVYALPEEAAIPRLSDPVTFDGRLTLLGWRWVSAPEDPTLQLLSYWEIGAPLPADLSIFLHFAGESGQPLAQHDGLDALHASLQPGDRLLQRHVISRPADLPAGHYELRLGLYERTSGRRWPLAGEGEDYFLMGRVEFDGLELRR